MSFHNYVLSDGILGLQSNTKYVGWSFGYAPHHATDAELDACRLVLRFNVDACREGFDDLDRLEKYHYWRSEPGSADIFYQRNFIMGSRLRLAVRGLLAERPEMITNRSFVKYVRFRFNNLHSPGYHLTDLTCARLLQLNLAPVHCSAFQVGESTVLVVAPPDSGKTLTTMRAIFDGGAKFMSEDLAISDGEYLYSCPWTSTFRYYDDLAMNWRTKFRMKLIKVFPPAELLPPPDKYSTIDAYIPTERIAAKGRITHVAILARRAGGIRELNKDDAKRLMFNLNRYEFVYMKNPMLVAYSYFNAELDLQELVRREREILAKIAEQATCLLVENADPTCFAGMILDRLK